MYGKNPDLAQNIRVAGINSVMGMLSFNLLLTGDTVMNGYNKEHPLKAHRGKFHHLKKTTWAQEHFLKLLMVKSLFTNDPILFFGILVLIKTTICAVVREQRKL